MSSTQSLAAAALSLLVGYTSACGSSTINDGGAGAGGHGGVGGSSPTVGELGDPCAGATCADELFCDFPDDQCGHNGVSGICQAASIGASTEVPSTICGCDGNIYTFWLAHEHEGVDAGALELCEPPDGKFFCGHDLCDDDGLTFCILPNVDCGQQPRCETLPAVCTAADADCSCFGDDALGCKRRSDGIFELGCFSG